MWISLVSSFAIYVLTYLVINGFVEIIFGTLRFCVLFVWNIRDYWGFRPCTSEARLDEKTAIVTGCNDGIGECNVLDFYRRGCRVIMACRNLEKAYACRKRIILKTDNEKNLGEIIVRQLDLNSFRSIRAFAEDVLKEEAKINILVNNAGAFSLHEPTEDGSDSTSQTNFFGPFLLTMLLLPRMLKSAPARIVNVLSLSYIGGKINPDELNFNKSGYHALKAYCNSKLAHMLTSNELAERLRGTGITVYSLHPGLTQSNMAYALGDQIGYFYNSFIAPLSVRTCSQAAQTQIYCAVDETIANETGNFYIDCRKQKRLAKGCDTTLGKQLWRATWDFVKLDKFDPFIPG